MKVLEIEGLCKRYPSFALKDVGFSLEKGRIMGFIGRNGAGKTTTLKSLLNFVHRDAGAIRFFGLDFDQHEREIKQRISFVSGGVDFYAKKKLRDISDATRRFYDHWDEKAYEEYMRRFALLDDKTPEQLSAGMRVKYLLALALSHHAELLLLDEPTSGLDPVSRSELLDVFLRLSEEGVTILFSTHITSDLDQCADDITYIRKGEILASEEIKGYVAKYASVSFAPAFLTDAVRPLLIGPRKLKDEYSALIRREDIQKLGLPFKDATLEDIMVHFEREEE